MSHINIVRMGLARDRMDLEKDRIAWMKELADGRAALVKDRAFLEEDKANQGAEFAERYEELEKHQERIEKGRRAFLAEVEEFKASILPPPGANSRGEGSGADKLKKDMGELRAIMRTEIELCQAANKKRAGLEEEVAQLQVARAGLEEEVAQLQVARAGLEEEERAVECELAPPLIEARLQRLEEAVFKMNVSVEEEDGGEPWYFSVVREAIMEKLLAQGTVCHGRVMTISRHQAVITASILHGAVTPMMMPYCIKSWLREFVASLVTHPHCVFDETKSLYDNYKSSVADLHFIRRSPRLVLNDAYVGNSSLAAMILISHAKTLCNDGLELD